MKFDFPNFLGLPLRLSGILVKENTDWKIQHLQFQFDLNVFFLFFTALILFFWLLMSLGNLLFKLLQRVKSGESLISSV